jgi:hypothetical protein
VHEHWNNATDKQYKKNLNMSAPGIHLVSIPESLVKSTNTLYAFNTQSPPTFDGNGTDECWQDAEWDYIDKTWIPYADVVDSTDFYGRFKVSWSKDSNLVYFLVETTDDVFVDGYTYDSNNYANFDCVELFIDEDNSGGPHVFDSTLWPGMSDCPSCNAENAFSYHMMVNDPGDNNSTSSLTACDIYGETWGNIANYASHFEEFIMHREGNLYKWEFALKVYDTTYDNGDPEASRVTLTDGKKMGFSMAYCDDDDGDRKRDHFFGSVHVAHEDSNNHWITADVFGKLILQTMYQVTFNVNDGSNAINNASVIFNGVQQFTNASGQTTFDVMAGNYAYNVTVAGADTATGNINVTSNKNQNISLNYSDTVGICKDTRDNPFSVYPNPGNGLFYVTIDNIYLNKNASLNVMNINGHVVHTNNEISDVNYINLSGLMPGMYIFKLSVNNKTFKELVILNK